MAVSTPQLKHNDDGAGEVGRRCTCPCVCGARKTLYKQLNGLPRELAMALEDPLTSFIEEHAMPERKWKMCIELEDCIKKALDDAFSQWQPFIKAKVLLDGSVLRGTALDDSDIDLVVCTEYPVPRSVKSAAHQIIMAGLQEKYGSGNVRFTEKRKSAEFVVETKKPNYDANDVDGTTVQDDRVACVVETVVLRADVLFDNATVGQPLSDIQQPFPEEGVKVVQMMKLFQRKAGSLPPLKGYVIEALVQNVLECGQPSEPDNAPNPTPKESVAQAFYMTLNLFLAENNARDLDKRVCHNLTVPSGFLFDRGDFECWSGRAYSFLRKLAKLATSLHKASGQNLNAKELLRCVVERSVPSKAPCAAAAVGAAAPAGDDANGGSFSQRGGEGEVDKRGMYSMPPLPPARSTAVAEVQCSNVSRAESISELIVKLKPGVEKALAAIGRPRNVVDPLRQLEQLDWVDFLRKLQRGQHGSGSVGDSGRGGSDSFVTAGDNGGGGGHGLAKAGDGGGNGSGSGSATHASDVVKAAPVPRGSSNSSNRPAEYAAQLPLPLQPSAVGPRMETTAATVQTHIDALQLFSGPQSAHGSVVRPGHNVAVSDGAEARAPPSLQTSSKPSSPPPVLLERQQSFAALDSSADPAVAAPEISCSNDSSSSRGGGGAAPTSAVSNGNSNSSGADGATAANALSNGGARSSAASEQLVCSVSIDHPLAALFAHPLAEEARLSCYMYRNPSGAQVALLASPVATPQLQPSGSREEQGGHLAATTTRASSLLSSSSSAAATAATATATATAGTSLADPVVTSGCAVAAATTAAIENAATLAVTHRDPTHILSGFHVEVAAAAAEAATATASNAVMRPQPSVYDALAERLRTEVTPRYLEQLQTHLRNAQVRHIKRSQTTATDDNTVIAATAAAAATASDVNDSGRDSA